MKRYFSLAFILALLTSSLWVRLFRINESPASVNWDEAALGYNSYSLLLTGRDEFGKPIPVSLRSFDDYKPAGYSYLSVPIIKLWGLSETTTRATSAIFGTLLVFFVVYITATISGSFTAGAAAGIITAFSPWAIHFSRIAFESNVAASWYLGGIAAFLLGRKNKNYYFVSLAIFIGSMYIYHAQRAIAVPTFVVLTIIFWRQIKEQIKKEWSSLLILAICMSVPLVISFATEPAASRLASTNILKLWPFVPKEFSVAIFNPVYSFLWQVSGQFLAYFSPANLFFRGSTEPILRIPGLSIFNAEILPFWIIGIWQVLKNRKYMSVLLPLLILAPLPGVITWNWFSVVRTLAVYPLQAIAAGIGFAYLWQKISGAWWRAVVFGPIMVFCFLAFLYNFLTINLFAPYITYGDFQPGFEYSVPYMLSESEKYNRVIIESPHIAPYIFVLFYGKYSPEKYLAEAGLNRKNSGTEDYAFGKYEFRKITHDELYGKNILLMGSTSAIPDWRKEEMEKIGIHVEDFPDPMGYTSFRVTSL